MKSGKPNLPEINLNRTKSLENLGNMRMRPLAQKKEFERYCKYQKQYANLEAERKSMESFLKSIEND